MFQGSAGGAAADHGRQRRDKDDLAIADLGSREPNILEESDEDAPVAKTTAPAGPRVPDFKGKTMARGAGGSG